MNQTSRNSRGSVLMSVLWIVLVLSLVSLSLASTVRVEMESASHAFDSERAFFMAKSAAEIVFNSYSKQLPIPDDAPIKQENGEYIFPFDSGEVRVSFGSDADRIDINQASDVLLASMFDSLGLDRETRNRLVDSVLDWIDTDDIPHLYGGEVADYPVAPVGQLRRPRNAQFQTVDELLLVRNMTPEIYFGSIVLEPVTGRYRRIPGLRDLVTLQSGDARVNPNLASPEVLAALPQMTAVIAGRVIAERTTRSFESVDDLLKRVPELNQKDTPDHFRFDTGVSRELVSRAVLKTSGISRTVRLLFKREEKLQFITFQPLVYKRVMETKFDRWRFE